MAQSAPGRHRAAGRHNPFTEIASVVSRPGLKASAVLAASGGLVAAVATPATAEPTPSPALQAPQAVTGPQAVTATFGITGFQGAPATDASTSTAATESAASTTTAVVAPTATTAPTETTRYGISGFTATARPKPKPIRSRGTAVSIRSATQRVDSSISRSTMRGSNPNSARTHGVASTQTRTATTTNTVTVKKPTAPTTATTSNVGSQIVSVARSLLGIYYVYGGTTPAGFDCSGFTMYVYKKVGITIPRTASQQQRAATRVSSPQPGDLVFIGSPAYHVGIYTKPGYFIDSPRSGKATSERKIWTTPSGYGRFR